jgi:DNA-binding transcriptional LysR family regulator
MDITRLRTLRELKVRETMAEMAQRRGEVSGELRVAAFSSVATALLPHAMAAMARAHPRVRVVFEDLESAEGLAALRAWKVDLALVDDLTVRPGQLDANIDLTPLANDSLYVIAPRQHRLARKGSVRIQDLRDEMWAIDLENHAFSSVIVAACRQAGFDPRINAYSSNLDVLLAFVTGGCSISMLPGLSIGPHRGRT